MRQILVMSFTDLQTSVVAVRIHMDAPTGKGPGLLGIWGSKWSPSRVRLQPTACVISPQCACGDRISLCSSKEQGRHGGALKNEFKTNTSSHRCQQPAGGMTGHGLMAFKKGLPLIVSSF